MSGLKKIKVNVPDSAKKASFRVRRSIKRKIGKSSSDGNLGGKKASREEKRTENFDDWTSQCTDNSLNSIVQGPGLKPGMDIQPHVNAALAVIDNISQSRSPSLRRISVVKDGSQQVDKTPNLPWRKKKFSEPTQKLVFSFSSEGDDDVFSEDQTKYTAQDSVTNFSEKIDFSERRERYPSTSQRKTSDFQSLPTMIVEGDDEMTSMCPLDESEYKLQQKTNSSESSGYKSLQVHHVDMETSSIRSFRSGNHTIISQEESTQVKKAKKQRFWDFLTMVSSIMYAFFIVSMGICVYVYDIMLRESKYQAASSYFNIFLVSIGIFWMLYLIIDIKRYVRKMEKQAYGTIDLGEMKLVEGPDGEFNIELNMPDEKKTLPDYYGFVSGRHSGSFYLKIGVGFFCAGHLVHMGVNVTKEIIFSMYGESDLIAFCSKPENIFIYCAIPIFSILQAYFIFKFGNVIVNKNKPLARFAFMHCLSSCLCMWMYTITNETVDALVEKFHDDHKCDQEEHDLRESEPLQPDCAGHSIFDCSIIERNFCVSSNRMSNSLFGTAAILYPFSIEFNILVVGIWYVLWSNIGTISSHKESMFFLPSVTPRGSQEAIHRTQGHHDALVVFADCKSSINGLFVGIFIFVITVIGAIVIYIMEQSCDKNLVKTSVDISNILESVILIFMIIVSTVTYYKIKGLEVNPDPISFLDDMLLLICIPMFLLYFVVCAGPTILKEFEVFYLVTNALTILQIFIQTPLIVDGLRRCTMHEEGQRKLRGRNSLMLLIVLNLAVYFLETILIKSKNNQKVKMDFYGKTGWTVLSHIILPLCIFYRFHSSAALVDIWTAAYKPPEHH